MFLEYPARREIKKRPLFGRKKKEGWDASSDDPLLRHGKMLQSGRRKEAESYPMRTTRSHLSSDGFFPRSIVKNSFRTRQPTAINWIMFRISFAVRTRASERKKTTSLRTQTFSVPKVEKKVPFPRVCCSKVG